MNLIEICDTILQHEIDEMRLMQHPTKEWLWEHKHGAIRAIIKYFPHTPQLARDALLEVDALRKDEPAKPYERSTNKVAVPV